jgi:hypothetical protein
MSRPRYGFTVVLTLQGLVFRTKPKGASNNTRAAPTTKTSRSAAALGCLTRLVDLPYFGAFCKPRN